MSDHKEEIAIPRSRALGRVPVKTMFFSLLSSTGSTGRLRPFFAAPTVRTALTQCEKTGTNARANTRKEEETDQPVQSGPWWFSLTNVYSRLQNHLTRHDVYNILPLATKNG